MKRTLRIGFLGLGTVGQGVWKHLKRNLPALERRLGAKLVLAQVAVRDPAKARAVRLPKAVFVSDPMAVATDPSIDIVCELIGGTGIARTATLAALQAGKVVVTANKALLCAHGEELFAAARAHGGHYFFEASVGGGIPVIKSLREGLVANRFPLVYGILNGTCNYILTRMEREQAAYAPIVEDARRLGYVEADASLDLDGWDTAHKAVILAFLAHGIWIPLDRVQVEGITRVSLDDIRWADQLGYRIKLLAVIRRDFKTDRVSVSVHPALLPRDLVLAHVDDVFNGVSITGDVVGTTVLIGRGAGPDATASAVISDIADAVAALLGGPKPTISEEDEAIYAALAREVTFADPKDITGQYYLRLDVADEPGVLADVAKILAKHEVSIAMVLQKPAGKKMAHLVLTTHESNEAKIKTVTAKLAQHPKVRQSPLVLRIFAAG